MASKSENEYSSEFDSDSDATPRVPSAKVVKKGTKNKPKRPSSSGKRPNSALGKSARELWSNAVKTGPAGGQRTRPASAGKSSSATERWAETLNKTGVGLTTQTMNTKSSMSGLRKGQSKNMAYSSTSHYLRQMVGTEKPNRKQTMHNEVPKFSPGTPAYKSQEEYYDEILDLKKQIAMLNTESSTMKSKIRRLEEDNLKKEREIEQLLDPSKSDELRRTLADRKPDAGAVIHSLKQKILKLEHQLRDKESAHVKLQADLKHTKVEEMKLQMETFYQEIVRLNQLKSVPQEANGPVKSSRRETKESQSKLKALQEAVLRMNEKNVRLQAENKALKQDLEKLLQEHAEGKEKQKEYEDMSKKQLLGAISKLEKRLDRTDADSASILSDIDSRKANTEGKIVLEGTVAQKLDQLDQRETELLEETDKQRSIIKRLKDDRAHYRKKCEEKDKDTKALKKEVEELHSELNSFYERDRSVPTPRTPKVTPRRGSKVMSSPRTRGRSRSPSVASVSSDSSTRREERERQRKIESFKQNRAAKSIQKNWRRHQRDEEQEEAAELIQSAMKGHLNRKKQLRRVSSDEDEEMTETVTDSDLDSAAEMLQSNVRGYWSRKEQIKRRSSTPPSRRSSTLGKYGKRLDSAGEEEDDDDILSSHSSRKPSLSGRASAQGFQRNKQKSPQRRSQQADNDDDESEDDSDDDDDIVVTGGRR